MVLEITVVLGLDSLELLASRAMTSGRMRNVATSGYLVPAAPLLHGSRGVDKVGEAEGGIAEAAVLEGAGEGADAQK